MFDFKQNIQQLVKRFKLELHLEDQECNTRKCSYQVACFKIALKEFFGHNEPQQCVCNKN